MEMVWLRLCKCAFDDWPMAQAAAEEQGSDRARALLAGSEHSAKYGSDDLLPDELQNVRAM